MNTQDGGHYNAAIDAIAVREYETAGNRYTRAGRRVLADPREGLDPFEPDEYGWIGQGLAQLLLAATTYRVAGVSDRARRRAVEGIAASRDFEGVLSGPAQDACLAEFVADFRVVGGLDGANDAAETAIDRYERVGRVDSPQAIATSPLFGAAALPIKQLARGQNNGEIAVEWDTLHGPDPSRPGEFLAHRVRYKRQRLASLVERAVTEGHLAAPRGTTAYNTDSHRCPTCESTDVNWAGTGPLCLRCSTPMEQR